MTKKKNELVPVDLSDYPALCEGNTAVAVMQENLGGEEVTAADLTRIKVPSGGATKWLVPTAGGEESLDKLEGVILHSTRRRAYWSNPDPTGDPPDCASQDCIAGVGNPGGVCGMPGKIPCCPNNEFGSARNKHGKACKEGRLVFLLRKGNILPDLIVAPPASLRSMRQYLLKVGQQGCPYWACVTSFSLEKTSNRDNIDYARIVPRLVNTLDEAVAEKVLAVVKQYETVFAGTGLDEQDAQHVEPIEV